MTAVRFRLRRDTKANWIVKDPVLRDGEPGVEIDTDRMKVGDGVTAWNALPYFLTNNETEVPLSSFPGANDDARLAAAMTAMAAFTLRGATILLEEKRDYTFTQQQTTYSGFALRSTIRVQDQPRSSRPIGSRILLRLAGATAENPKGWFKNPAGVSTFGLAISGLSIDGDANSGFMEGNEADGGVLWTSSFRDISVQNAAFIFGTPANRLRYTACSIGGWWNINNVRLRAWHIGGSDFWWNPEMLLLDSPPELMADSGYLASLEFMSNSWWSNIYCTAERHSALFINGGLSSHSNWMKHSVFEGRNAGAPCLGALIRMHGSEWTFSDCRFAFAMADPAANGRNDRGVIHQQGGTLTLDGCKYERGNTAESVPFLYVSGGTARVRNIRPVGAAWTGKPVVKQAVPGLIDADDSVTLVTAQAATAPAGAGDFATASAASGTSITINKPANTADGNLLVAAVHSRAASAPYTTPPAGWTEVAPSADNTAAGVTRFYIRKVAAASSEPASYAWAGGGSGRHAGVIFRVTGYDTSTQVDAVGAVATLIGGPDRVIEPSVTTTTEGALLVKVATASSTGGVPVTFTPTGGTKIADAATATGGSESALTVAVETVAAAGATGTRVMTASGSASTGMGYMFAIRSAG